MISSFRDKERATDLLFLRHELWVVFSAIMKTQGRSILLLLFSSLLLLVVGGTTLVVKLLFWTPSWQSALWCWGLDSSLHLLSSPAGSHWVPPIGDAEGRLEDRRRKGDLALPGYLLPPPDHPRSGPLSSQWQFAPVPSIFVFSSPRTSLSIPHQRSQYQLGSAPFLNVWVPAECDSSSNLTILKTPTTFPLFS